MFLGLILMREKKNEHFMLSLLIAMQGELNCWGKCFPRANSLTRGGPAAEISLCRAYAVMFGLGSVHSSNCSFITNEVQRDAARVWASPRDVFQGDHRFRHYVPSLLKLFEGLSSATVCSCLAPERESFVTTRRMEGAMLMCTYISKIS